jgi:WD40 repeat protein
MRNDKPLHTYTDLHSDEVTSLAFHRSSPNLLLSGSTDGLFSIVDCSQSDEEEAVLGVGSVPCLGPYNS